VAEVVAGESRRRAWALRGAVVWGIFLFILTSWPKPPEVPVLSGIPDFDKLVHFGLYGIEAFLIYRAIAWPGWPRFSLARILAVAGLMAVWGILDETHQYWIPGRSMEGGDVAGDVAGALAGATLASALSRSRRADSPG
jgi:VanZ family protein